MTGKTDVNLSVGRNKRAVLDDNLQISLCLCGVCSWALYLLSIAPTDSCVAKKLASEIWIKRKQRRLLNSYLDVLKVSFIIIYTKYFMLYLAHFSYLCRKLDQPQHLLRRSWCIVHRWGAGHATHILFRVGLQTFHGSIQIGTKKNESHFRWSYARAVAVASYHFQT